MVFKIGDSILWIYQGEQHTGTILSIEGDRAYIKQFGHSVPLIELHLREHK